MTSSGLTFGIYPLSAAGTPFGLAVGPADDYDMIRLALRDLRGEDHALFPRLYLVYTKEWESKMLELADRYFSAGLSGDWTLGCGDWTDPEPSIEFDGWLGFIRKIIVRYGASLSSVQITNEPNLSFMEGSKPYILQALTEGVIAAKKEVRKLGLPLEIGFGSVPESQASVPEFWEKLGQSAGSEFKDSVDFVGHNFYTDVFEEKPLHIDEIPAAVENVLRDLRENSLPAVGISDAIPIRIAENGWPTGKNPLTGMERTPERQSEVLETVIQTAYRLHRELNISHYILFGLRDADSSKEDLFHQFGITRDDYTPKPAYTVFKRLIGELGVSDQINRNDINR
jgi:hypothetical protein